MQLLQPLLEAKCASTMVAQLSQVQGPEAAGEGSRVRTGAPLLCCFRGFPSYFVLSKLWDRSNTSRVSSMPERRAAFSLAFLVAVCSVQVRPVRPRGRYKSSLFY